MGSRMLRNIRKVFGPRGIRNHISVGIRIATARGRHRLVMIPTGQRCITPIIRPLRISTRFPFWLYIPRGDIHFCSTRRRSAGRTTAIMGLGHSGQVGQVIHRYRIRRSTTCMISHVGLGSTQLLPDYTIRVLGITRNRVWDGRLILLRVLFLRRLSGLNSLLHRIPPDLL